MKTPAIETAWWMARVAQIATSRRGLRRGEMKISHIPIASERLARNVKFEVAQQLLLAALVAIVAVIFGLAS